MIFVFSFEFLVWFLPPESIMPMRTNEREQRKEKPMAKWLLRGVIACDNRCHLQAARGLVFP
jgi:hypothetical protein